MTATDSAGAPEVRSLAFLEGGGAMGAMVRQMDWSETPLGNIEDWPQSLRSAVSICLGSAFPIAIYWGPDLALLYNDAWCAIPGAKHPGAVGQPAREVWPEIWDTIGPLFDHVITTGEATRSKDQLLAMRRYGYTEECYFDYTFSPIRGESGRVEGIFNAVLETTERVIGERRLRIVREFAERAAEARTSAIACQIAAETLGKSSADIPFALFYLLSANGTDGVLAANAGLDRGTPASPVKISLKESDDAWSIAEVARTGAAKRIESLDAIFSPLQGNPLPGGPWSEPPGSAVVLPVARAGSERPHGVLVAGISPRRALDDDYLAFLNVVTSHMGQALTNADACEEERKRAEALAEIDRAKTAFFSNVSHEFRTPLTLMLGPVEELMAIDRALPPRAVDLLSIAHRNGLRLQKLVNTLLDFSRIEAGRVQAWYEPTDLSALTADLASTFRSAIETAGLQFVVECPPLGQTVYIDPEMWEKIVLNLLSNAFKYTFEGKIVVRLDAVKDYVRLSVEDSGTGIPESELPLLFDRFHRVEAASGRTQEGTGIGLALVSELTQLHGGRVEVRSTVGLGSTFTILLPFGSAHLPPGRVIAARDVKPRDSRRAVASYVEQAAGWLPHDRLPPVTDPNSGSARIVLADDNADMRDYVARLLADRYEVEAVANGTEALARVLENPPDLLLSDVMMPGLDGFGLLAALRARAETSALPVILLSARAGEEASSGGLEAGASDYLVKPFTARELLARVGTHLEMARVRKQATDQEAALRAEAEEARDKALSVLESIKDGFFTLDRDWCLTYVNAAGERMLGAGRDELLGKNHWELYPASVGTNLETEYRRAARDRVPVELESFYTPWRRWFAVKAYPTEQGGISVYFRDVTDQKESEERLRQQWHIFDTALSNTPDATYVLNCEGRFVYANRTLLARLNKPLTDVAGKNFFELGYPNELATRVHRQIEELRQTRLPVHGETALTNPAGVVGHYEYIFVPVFSDSGEVEAIAGSTRDVTERKQDEERERGRQAQLRDSARLESLGVMAGGVAHDFNNLLVGILGNASLLVETVSESDRAVASGIVLAAERAAQLTKQMLAYSGKGHFVIEVVDLNTLMQENLTLLRASLSRSVTVEIELAREACLVEADRTQIHQVIMNLLLNASEAVGESAGRVLIRTGRARRDSQLSAHLHAVVPEGNYAVLEIQDNGVGMTSETLKKIFDPFFTTKFIGRGLGLAAVLGIIKGHRGDIEVASVPGAGTTFRVFLPLSTRVAPSPHKTEYAAPAAGPAQTVLVVDDEEVVRKTAAVSLKRRGFSVLLATNGAEALDVLRTQQGISLVILDLTMPVMTGEQALPLIRSIYPDIPIILSSGFNEAEVSRRFASSGIAGVLQKPYTVIAITTKVQQVLAAIPAKPA